MTTGRAAKVALDAKLLVEFIDHHTTYRTDGVPKRRRRYVNGVCLDADTDARIIRRWRSKIEGVTPAAADRLLRKTGLYLEDFGAWASSNGRSAWLRGGN